MQETNRPQPTLIDSAPGITHEGENQEPHLDKEDPNKVKSYTGSTPKKDPSISTLDIMDATSEQLREKRKRWERDNFTGKVATEGIFKVPKRIRDPQN